MESILGAEMLIEENRSLKRYIDELNKECLDLQTSLFEEANKMAKAALASQNKAEKQAQEKGKENGVLRAEVVELKRILKSQQNEKNLRDAIQSSMPTLDTTAEKFSTRNNPTTCYYVGTNIDARPLQSSRPSALSLPPRFSSSRRENRSAVINTITQEPATRKSIFDALTNESGLPRDVDNQQYQEFLAWVQSGCCLNLPLSDVVTESVEEQEDVNTSPPKLLEPLRPTNLLFAGAKPGTDSSSPIDRGFQFIQRLEMEDISPCLQFAEPRVQRALRLALPYLAIEMEPLSSSSSQLNDDCLLVPGHKCAYLLQFDNLNSLISSSTESLPISASARQRIAAVTDLFQYLTLIGRDLTGTPDDTLKCAFPETSETAIDAKTCLRYHQFRNVQRRRAAVTLARLGYGLPLLE